MTQSKTGQPVNGAATSPEERALGQVRRAIEEIEYGSVLVKIHQGKVVGIETSTKLRLQEPDATS